MTKETKKRLLPMDELRWRPCEVDGVPALFHRWIEEDSAVLHVEVFAPPGVHRKLVKSFQDDRVVAPGCRVDVLRETFALVEYLDGLVAKVKPERIRFVDKEG